MTSPATAADTSTRGVGPHPWRTVSLLALTTIVSHSLARSTYPILLPAIEADLLSSHQQSGTLSTINFGAYLGGVALVTTISGRFEPARLLFAGLIAAVAGFVVLSQANGFATLALGLGLAGAASAGIWMSTPVIAASLVGANRRGLVMGMMSSIMGVGIVVTSQSTNLIRSVGNNDGLWRPIWVGAAVYSLAVLLLLALLLRAPATARVTGGISFARLRAVPGWGPLTAAHLLFGLAISSFTPFFGASLEEHGFSRSHVANLYSLFGLAAVLVAVNLGRASDRIGRRPVLLGAQLVLAAAALLVLVGREPFATASAFLFGGASYTFPVLITAYLSDHVRDRALQSALSTLTLLYGTTLTIGPFLSGTIGDSRYGFRAVFIGVAVACVLGAQFIYRLPRGGANPTN